MKLRPLLAFLTLAAVTGAPAAFAKKPESAGQPAAAEQAGVAKPAEAAAKSEDKGAEVKGLKRDEFKRLNAAREKAEADPSVKAAFAKKAETQKAYLAAKKAGDNAAVTEAAKARDAAHAAWIKARRDAITKADPEAGKLDEQVFANMKAMREIKARKEAEAAGAAPAGKSEGPVAEPAPGRVKQERAAGKAHAKGKRQDPADGEKKNDAKTE